MPRPPRIQFPGANYHIVTRGDGRQKLFHDQAHYERFTTGLEEEVQRCGWIVLAYCWMPNHIHALIQTPEPNLATGMQHWLSGYANWYAKRNRRTGHLYQGRYKAFLVEDAGYYWTLSRYIHLNPCRGSNPLGADPESWPYSSFGGGFMGSDLVFGFQRQLSMLVLHLATETRCRLSTTDQVRRANRGMLRFLKG